MTHSSYTLEVKGLTDNYRYKPNLFIDFSVRIGITLHLTNNYCRPILLFLSNVNENEKIYGKPGKYYFVKVGQKKISINILH